MAARRLLIVMLVLLGISTLAAALIQMTISRTREYSADKLGAEISGNPLGLADALRKISAYARRIVMPSAERNPTSAPLFMLVIEPLAAYAFLRGKRAGAVVLAALTGLSTVAFAFDGDFNDYALGPGHVAWQLLEGWLALVVFSLAVTALIRTRRSPAAAAGA